MLVLITWCSNQFLIGQVLDAVFPFDVEFNCSLCQLLLNPKLGLNQIHFDVSRLRCFAVWRVLKVAMMLGLAYTLVDFCLSNFSINRAVETSENLYDDLCCLTSQLQRFLRTDQILMF